MFSFFLTKISTIPVKTVESVREIIFFSLRKPSNTKKTKKERKKKVISANIR